MAERRWQPPAAVRRVAAVRSAWDPENDLLRDLATGVSVSANTLVASSLIEDAPEIVEWAKRTHDSEERVQQAKTRATLVAAGFNPDSCDDPTEVYGLMPDAGSISNVIRIDETGQLMRWEGSGWATVPDGMEPDGIEYIAIPVQMADLLAEALDAVGRGGSLAIRSIEPRGYLSTPEPMPIVAAGPAEQLPQGKVFATVDDMDSSAVLSVFQVLPGPIVQTRTNGAWVLDDGTLMASLNSLDPPAVVLITPTDLPSVLRQIDDYDKIHPATPPRPITAGSGANNSGVMVALPISPATADQMAVPEGEDPQDLHVTLSYLGDAEDAGISETDLIQLVRQWAAEQQPMTGEISGPGTFTAGDVPVHVALPDIPNLPSARENLVSRLEDAGANHHDDHGYTPHVTLRYSEDPDDHPGCANLPLSFPGVGVYYGDNRTDIPFGPQALTAAGVFDEALHPRVGGKFAAKGTAAAPPANSAAGVSNYIATGDTSGVTSDLVAKPAKGAGGTAGNTAAKAKAAAMKQARVRAALAKKQAAAKARIIKQKQMAAKKAAAAKVAAQKAAAAKLARDTQQRNQALRAAYQLKQQQISVANQNKDDSFTLAQVKSDQAEQDRRTAFDTANQAMFQQLKAQGLTDNQAALQVSQAAQQEVQRRQTWQTQRAATVTAEKERRLSTQISTRNQQMTAQAKLLADMKLPFIEPKSKLPVTPIKHAVVKPAAHTIAKRPVTAAAKSAEDSARGGMPDNLEDYWLGPKGSAKLLYGVRGYFKRCQAELGKHLKPEQVDGACARLYHAKTGTWPKAHDHEKGSLVKS